jgi:hypothetical protein
VRNQRRRRILMRQGQSSEAADISDNRGISYGGEQWEIKPELGASEAHWTDVRQGRMRSVAHAVGEVPNNSLPELHGTPRNIVEVPDNPIYELHNTRT